mmetsp:Transcript_10639/g.10487  ORF Transcript_10639/g.10487 Transcript_10639/m.10487 type:complete len:112 (-) Transcript_10639:76-411(-)|eukprot:CAMPEP_0197004748 /NCGR_PEP_ID=MMETSP1380-20130617/25516_1 /TAXON_ID=5936 /ORGANISM="Euplotes crassus, Strain CT5" /LENGTH=111 /DNA_ID=CAMNT_0042423651 /DNA_START=403 /DNA_END=738 /DNA_ORIENTATION=+
MDQYDAGNGMGRDNRGGDGNDGQFMGGQNNSTFNLLNEDGDQESHKEELELKLLDSSSETLTSIKDVVMCLKSQNYEEAKRMVTDLMSDNKIWFQAKNEEHSNPDDAPMSD